MFAKTWRNQDTLLSQEKGCVLVFTLALSVFRVIVMKNWTNAGRIRTQANFWAFMVIFCSSGRSVYLNPSKKRRSDEEHFFVGKTSEKIKRCPKTEEENLLTLQVRSIWKLCKSYCISSSSLSLKKDLRIFLRNRGRVRGWSGKWYCRVGGFG